jgi:hypothetical protein
MSKFLKVLAQIGVKQVKYSGTMDGYKASVSVAGLPTELTRTALVKAVEKTAAFCKLTATGDDSEDDNYSTEKLILSGADGAATLRTILQMSSPAKKTEAQ